MSVSGVNRNVLLFLKQINYLSTQQVDAIVVSSFLEYHQINISIPIVSLLSDEEKDLEQQFIARWRKYQASFDFEDLIELFEFIVSPADKEVNGAVYTPRYIREYIVDEVFKYIPENEIQNVVIGDLACGCGGFLITLAEKLHHQYGLKYSWIYSHNIIGVDIAKYSVERTKIMLKLLALLEHESIEGEINVYCQNSLSYDFRNIEVVRNRNGFDAVVGNPPYVSSAKMSEETKALVARYETARSGKADLYIPFFQLAIEALRTQGILGYITVNNFYRSVNGRALRKWFSRGGLYVKLIDFGGEQIFKSRSTYTCLCFVHRVTNGYVDYVKASIDHLANLSDAEYEKIEYANLDNLKGWLLASDKMSRIISQIEKCGKPIGERYSIVNGFATLNNKVYVFSPKCEDNNTYTLSSKHGEYKIEKSICRDAIKPNILQTESDVEQYIQKVIFPYRVVNDTVVLIPESEMIRDYPLTYKYLSAFKEELSERDKGKRVYDAWYGYGRTQALNIPGYKLLFPYIAERPRFILSQDENLLFYNGYAICSERIDDLIFIKKILETDLFWRYICETSKPYSNGYYALAKNYIKYFGVPEFTENQKRYIMEETDATKRNKYLAKIYKIISFV